MKNTAIVHVLVSIGLTVGAFASSAQEVKLQLQQAGTLDGTGSEIVAHDLENQRIFITNSSDPSAGNPPTHSNQVC